MDRPSPVPSPAGLCRKERAEQLLFHLRHHTSAVVAYPDFYPVAEVLGRSSQRRLVVASIRQGAGIDRHPRALDVH
jgi:hypothetical protein